MISSGVVELRESFASFLWFAFTLVIPVYGYFASQFSKRPLSHIVWVLGIGLCCCIPYTVPPHYNSSRWWLSLVTFMTALKMVHAWALNATFPSVAAAVHFFLVPMAPPYPLPVAIPNKARDRVLRGVLKVAALLVMFFLNSALNQYIVNNLFLAAFFSLWCVYFAVTGFVDIYTGAVMFFSNWDSAEFCNDPFLSTSPRDFWSRRWNMLFRNIMHTCVFQPLKSLGIPPIIGVVGVLFISAFVHEYMVFVSCKSYQWLGWMSAFFVVHAVATVLDVIVSKNPTWIRLTKNVPNGVWVVAHISWILLTAPLFFTPALQCMPFLSWRFPL